jgi:murein DD-endopeptidase MepM/ murein hydrolase activator NlpD
MALKSSILLFLLYLTGCSSLQASPAPEPSPAKPSPTCTCDLSTSRPPTATQIPSPSAIETVTEVPSLIPSQLPASVVPEPTVEWIYIFPVQPASLAGFVEGVSSHGFPATDIFAPEGTRFVAVTSGVVDFVSYEDRWDPALDDQALRGGISIAIIGIDGVRYYGSHLSAIATGIKAGDQVIAGQLLGYIGHTGNARNTLSHVHFGISHPTFPEDWRTRRGEVDPFLLLVAWRDGHNITPPLPSP